MPPPGGCFGLWSACYCAFVIFSLVLCLTLSTSSGVLVIVPLLFFPWFFVLLCLQAVVFLLCFPFCSSTVFFKCWPPDLRGWEHDILFFSSFCFHFFLHPLRFVFLFLFSLRMFPFVSLFRRMCMSCLSYLV